MNSNLYQNVGSTPVPERQNSDDQSFFSVSGGNENIHQPTSLQKKPFVSLLRDRIHDTNGFSETSSSSPSTLSRSNSAPPNNSRVHGNSIQELDEHGQILLQQRQQATQRFGRGIFDLESFLATPDLNSQTPSGEINHWKCPVNASTTATPSVIRARTTFMTGELSSPGPYLLNQADSMLSPRDEISQEHESNNALNPPNSTWQPFSGPTATKIGSCTSKSPTEGARAQLMSEHDRIDLSPIAPQISPETGLNVGSNISIKTDPPPYLWMHQEAKSPGFVIRNEAKSPQLFQRHRAESTGTISANHSVAPIKPHGNPPWSADTNFEIIRSAASVPTSPQLGAHSSPAIEQLNRVWPLPRSGNFYGDNAIGVTPVVSASAHGSPRSAPPYYTSQRLSFQPPCSPPAQQQQQQQQQQAHNTHHMYQSLSPRQTVQSPLSVHSIIHSDQPDNQAIGDLEYTSNLSEGQCPQSNSSTHFLGSTSVLKRMVGDDHDDEARTTSQVKSVLDVALGENIREACGVGNVGGLSVATKQLGRLPYSLDAGNTVIASSIVRDIGVLKNASLNESSIRSPLAPLQLSKFAPLQRSNSTPPRPSSSFVGHGHSMDFEAHGFDSRADDDCARDAHNHNLGLSAIDSNIQHLQFGSNMGRDSSVLNSNERQQTPQRLQKQQKRQWHGQQQHHCQQQINGSHTPVTTYSPFFDNHRNSTKDFQVTHMSSQYGVGFSDTTFAGDIVTLKDLRPTQKHETHSILAKNDEASLSIREYDLTYDPSRFHSSESALGEESPRDSNAGLGQRLQPSHLHRQHSHSLNQHSTATMLSSGGSDGALSPHSVSSSTAMNSRGANSIGNSNFSVSCISQNTELDLTDARAVARAINAPLSEKIHSPHQKLLQTSQVLDHQIHSYQQQSPRQEQQPWSPHQLGNTQQQPHSYLPLHQSQLLQQQQQQVQRQQQQQLGLQHAFTQPHSVMAQQHIQHSPQTFHALSIKSNHYHPPQHSFQHSSQNHYSHQLQYPPQHRPQFMPKQNRPRHHPQHRQLSQGHYGYVQVLHSNTSNNGTQSHQYRPPQSYPPVSSPQHTQHQSHAQQIVLQSKQRHDQKPEQFNSTKDEDTSSLSALTTQIGCDNIREESASGADPLVIPASPTAIVASLAAPATLTSQPTAVTHSMPQLNSSGIGIGVDNSGAASNIPGEETDLNHGGRSALLEEFRCNKSNKKFELKDITGSFVEFSSDQHGSRFIQQRLETAAEEEKAQLFAEIVPRSLQLMTDVFGNYVIQKLFEYGNIGQREALVKSMEGHILSLALQMYGCRVVQKGLEYLGADTQLRIVSELRGQVLKCVKDQNGNHVIQKAIECCTTEHLGFIMEAFCGQVYALATHPYGCRVIQRMLEHCSATKSPLLEELDRCILKLVQDQYGNYVIQHILERGAAEEKSLVICKVMGHVLPLSKHKFASNVVEKCVAYGTVEERRLLIQEVMTDTSVVSTLLPPAGAASKNILPSGLAVSVTPVLSSPALPLVSMMKDQFANYVVQKMLDVVDEGQREELVTKIKPHLPALKKYTYGKHLINKVDKVVALQVT